MINIYEAQSANKRKSLLVVLLFTVFVAVSVYILTNTFIIYSGYEPGGFGMVGLALIISGVGSYLSYYFSDTIILSVSKARPALRNTDSLFFTLAENLSLGAGIPKPKLYVIDDSAPNAFACGRDPNYSTICATTGLLSKLNKSELEGVLAHEIAHIENYDCRLQTTVCVMVGFIALLGDWLLRVNFRGGTNSEERKGAGLFLLLGLVFAFLSPFIAQIIQLAISRRREFLADAGSVFITKQPKGLIQALRKISGDIEPLEVANKATAHLYIVNPFKEKDKRTVGWLAGLFNTHPPINQRIKALESMV